MARLLTTLVLLLACLLGLIIEINANTLNNRLETEAAIRIKRQAVSIQRPAADQIRPSMSLGGSSGVSATASALSSATTNDGQLEPSISSISNTPSRRPKRPKIPALEVSADSELAEEEIDDERPAKVKKPKRRRPASNRRPANYDDQEASGEDYEDCSDDYDYGHPHAFHEAATRPMRHFSRMMEGMFSRMRGLAAGDFEGIPGGNSAVASSTSNGDGYSRVSSVVNNNGRTRGIVTETRDGRTKTRRIDSGDDDDEEE